MHALAVVGLASYGGGFHNTAAMNFCCGACFWFGALLLIAAFWHIWRAPERKEATLPSSEAPRP